MKDAVQALVRSLTGDSNIYLTHRTGVDTFGKWNIFDVSRAGKHLYKHSFSRGYFKPMDMAKKIVETLKEEKLIK